VYERPFAPHACLEPNELTVHVRPDGAEACFPRKPSMGPEIIAKVSGFPWSKVDVTTTLLGGGFVAATKPIS